MSTRSYKKITLKLLIILLITVVMLSLSGVCVQANSVEYRGEAEGLIATPDDFFLDFGMLLPGDKREGVAYIKNTTNDEIEVFFKTEPLDKSEYYDDIDYSLLEKISLKITLKQTSSSEEKVLFDGNLGAESMSEFISLGEYSKGFDGEFVFKIEVPTSLRNDYTLSRTKVKWVFAVEKKDKAEPEPEPKPEPENPDEPTKQDDNPEKPGHEGDNQKEDKTEDKIDEKIDEKTEDKNPVSEIIKQVQTGDKIYYIIGIMVIAILMAVTLFIPKNKRGK